ncbi:MAG: ATPase [Bacteroidales bacterium]|nr:ATPase [Bacteroidales bacterium]
MDTPFIYGRIAEKENFTDREIEVDLLLQNFSGRINTVIISPRRWGKTSLVNKAARLLVEKHKNIHVCQIDIFNCRTEEEFYKVYANTILRTCTTAWEEFIVAAKKYLGRLLPIVSLSDASQSYEFSFGIDFKDPKYSYDEILDLPETIAQETGKKFIICIDEFQNINEYEDPIGFQRKLRSHWQRHTDVGYCLYGSKRHMLLDIFNNYEMPFYKFGDILFLSKIEEMHWVKFISERFASTGKSISQELCKRITALSQCHPYYTQQLSQQVWLRTTGECTAHIVESAFQGVVGQLSLLFTNILDSLTPKQINFLIAVSKGESSFSSKEVLSKYQLGTSANVKNLKKATLEKDLIDIQPGNKIEIQDPIFEYWLKNVYSKHTIS